MHRDRLKVAEDVASRETLKGEVVLLVGPPVKTAVAPAAQPFEAAEIRARVAALMEAGESRTSAVKKVARESGLDRGLVYDMSTEA